ncbi:MAG: thioesterase family protein [Firmicutes bacterium]|nr:thioesterase family protein [Bacillota bacterium]
MENFDDLKVGLVHTLQKKVTIDDTALNYGSGKIQNLFATPKLVAFMVEASSQLMDPLLPEGFISIGHHVEVDHFKPTLLGATVTIEVKIEKIENGKYTLSMRAYDEYGQIGRGNHTRSVVPYNRLMEKAENREREPFPEE